MNNNETNEKIGSIEYFITCPKCNDENCNSEIIRVDEVSDDNWFDVLKCLGCGHVYSQEYIASKD